MFTVSINQARQRFKTLPPEIQDMVFAPQTADIIRKIGEQYRLSGEKTGELGRIAGLVLLGFVHAEDAGKEISEDLSVNSGTAQDLQEALRRKLFSPFSNTLERIYSPNLPPEEPEPLPQPRVSLDSIMPAAPKTPAPQSGAPAPKPIEAVKAVPPAATPSVKAAPAPFVPAATKQAPSAAPSPAAPKPAPAPFIIHQETAAAPLAQAPRFRIEAKGQTGSAFAAGKTQPTPPPPPKPAQIEFGKIESIKPVRPTVSKIESAPRVVHYGGLSTPLDRIITPAPAVPAPIGQLQNLKAVPQSPIAPKPEIPIPAKPIMPAPAAQSASAASPKPQTEPALNVKPSWAEARPKINPLSAGPAEKAAVPKTAPSVQLPKIQPPVAAEPAEAKKPDVQFGNFLKNMVSPAKEPPASSPPPAGKTPKIG